jgi:pyruvoyl-dependent arginine decarboxylase (PvlArgDC)
MSPWGSGSNFIDKTANWIWNAPKSDIDSNNIDTINSYFTNNDIDYKKSAFVITNALSDCENNLSSEFSEDFLEDKKVKKNGGQNKQIIMLSIKCFKSLCLKVGTKKADEIHDYYIKLEEIVQEVINEENNELKLQLEQKDKQILSQELKNEKDKQFLKEKTLLEQFPLNTQCIYIGKIDNKTLGKPNSKMYHESVIKFGQSNNLAERVKCHKKTYDNFILYNAYKVKNKIEIENLIKKSSILEKRLRLITTEDGIAHRELLALDNSDFTIEKMEDYIKEIIKQNEYNLENYNLLLKKNDSQEEEIIHLKQELERQNKQNSELSNKLQNYTGEGDITNESKNKIASNYALCKYGYFLYVFQIENMRFICSITRQKDFETLTNNLINLYPQGLMKYKSIVSYPFSEKNMMFLLKQHCVSLGNNKFEASFEEIKKILDIATKLETVLIENAKDLNKLYSIINNENTEEEQKQYCEPIDHEAPLIRKAKRPIDQINKDTGEIIKTFESIEAAGRSLGLTTGTAIGIALREKRVSQGFLWRYSGISKEEQFNEQPVIKISCYTGAQTSFKTIADAAKDAKISAPALRQRIITKVHLNNHHWIFDKNASHYNV